VPVVRQSYHLQCKKEEVMEEEGTGADLIVTAALAISLVIAVVFIANLIGAIHVYG
jgi:hypothetical protein